MSVIPICSTKFSELYYSVTTKQDTTGSFAFSFGTTGVDPYVSFSGQSGKLYDQEGNYFSSYATEEPFTIDGHIFSDRHSYYYNGKLIHDSCERNDNGSGIDYFFENKLYGGYGLQIEARQPDLLCLSRMIPWFIDMFRAGYSEHFDNTDPNGTYSKNANLFNGRPYWTHQSSTITLADPSTFTEAQTIVYEERLAELGVLSKPTTWYIFYSNVVGRWVLKNRLEDPPWANPNWYMFGGNLYAVGPNNDLPWEGTWVQWYQYVNYSAPPTPAWEGFVDMKYDSEVLADTHTHRLKLSTSDAHFWWVGSKELTENGVLSNLVISVTEGPCLGSEENNLFIDSYINGRIEDGWLQNKPGSDFTVKS